MTAYVPEEEDGVSLQLEEDVASVEVRPHHTEGMVIEELYVPPIMRRRGIATRLLQNVQARHRCKLWIKPRAFGDMPMTDEELKIFYEKMGFTVDKSGYMVYIPKEHKNE